MFRGDLLRVAQNLLDLLPQPLLDLGVVDEAEDHGAKGGGAGVEPGKEEEEGCGDEADLEVLLGQEDVRALLLQLLDEYIYDVVSLCACFSKTYILVFRFEVRGIPSILNGLPDNVDEEKRRIRVEGVNSQEFCQFGKYEEEEKLGEIKFRSVFWISTKI